MRADRRRPSLLRLPSSSPRARRQRRWLLLGLAALCACGWALRPRHQVPLREDVPVGALPWRVAVDEIRGRAFVVNNGDNTVSLLDTRSGTLLRTVRVGVDPRWVEVDAGLGRAYVSNGGDGTVTVLDGRDGRLLGTMRVGAAPRALAIEPRAHLLFAANSGDDSISTLDIRSGVLLRTTRGCPNPSALALDTRRHRLFARGDTGAFCSIDAATGLLLHREQVGLSAAGMLAVDAPRGHVFVSNFHDGTVSLMDAASGRPLRTLAVNGYLAVSASTDRVFVLDEPPGNSVPPGGINGYAPPVSVSRGSVSVLDARDGRLLRRTPVDANPWFALLDPRSGHLLVSCLGSTDNIGDYAGIGSLDVLDARTGALLRRIPAGVGAHWLAVDAARGRAFVVNSNINFDYTPTHLQPPSPADRGPSALAWLRGWLPGVEPVRPQPAPADANGSVTVIDTTGL